MSIHPGSFNLRVGSAILPMPTAEQFTDDFMISLIFPEIAKSQGYHDLAWNEYVSIRNFLRSGASVTTPEPVSKIELPDHERGRSAEELRRLDRLNARLARPDLKGEKRDSALRERERLERRVEEVREKAWQDESRDETAALAQARGEDIDRKGKGPIRVVSRDPLLSLLRKGHLTAEQYDAGVTLKDAYERRSEGVGSQLGAVNSVGGAHNNDGCVMAGLQRAKALQRIGVVERCILAGFSRDPRTGGQINCDAWRDFRAQDAQPHVALAVIRAVCSEGKALTSQGEGRAFERNLKAFRIALDVAREAMGGR